MDQLFEIARKTFDTPEFRGITFIESEAKSIINRVPGGALPFDWTINPYRGCSHACTYCFARPTHTYLDMNAGRDFETKIVVKVNAPDVLRRELAAKRWKGEHIAMGTATDPYQRAEGRYKLMRGIMEALIDHRNPFSILTKGTLILRDLDLLQRGAEVAPVSAAFSIGTLDEQVWRATEPGTPHPRARIEAIRTLTEGGIPTRSVDGADPPGDLGSSPTNSEKWSVPPSTRERPTSRPSCCTSGPAFEKSSSRGWRRSIRTSSSAISRCTGSPTGRRVSASSSADRCRRWSRPREEFAAASSRREGSSAAIEIAIGNERPSS